jgi:Protein of unknown function (DUF1501)
MTDMHLATRTRRHFLGTGLAGGLGLALAPAFRALLADDPPARRAQSCIFVWLNGGPSHIDTFDPKPGSSTNGPFSAIDTKIAGVAFSQHLPRLAQAADRLALIRSMNSPEGDHDRGNLVLHTGNVPAEAVAYPGLGSVVAREWSVDDGDLPAFVTINGSSAPPGFFGAGYAPYTIANVDAPLENVALLEGITEERFEKRLAALDRFNALSSKRLHPRTLAEQQRLARRVRRFRKSPALGAFDLSQETPETLVRYGVPQGEGSDPAAGVFGRACLMARRLIEQQVRFVEVTLDGWDTHANNFAEVESLSQKLDPALDALIADLADRGLLEKTLVVCLGEFGRTPQINAATGRDHWADAFSLLLAGGGIRGGQVIGATDAKGEKVVDRPVSPADLFATLLSALGIDGQKVYKTPEGRPIRLAEKGSVIGELFG